MTLRLAGYEVGVKERGGGRSIVLLHGYACSMADWDAVAEQLVGLHVVQLDFPNHGTSPDVGAVRYQNLVDIVIALLDALSLERPLLVGHSMGGMTALAVATQVPRSLAGLILADAFPHLPSVVDVFGGPEDPDDPFGYGSVLDRGTPLDVAERVRSAMARGAERTGAELFDSLVELDLRKSLADIYLPSLLLLGGRRWVTTTVLPTVLKGLGYEGLAGLEAMILDSHHFVMLEQPAVTADAIHSFSARAMSVPR